MAARPHLTMRQRNDLQRAERREETRIAIAEGRVTVRQMTAKSSSKRTFAIAARDAARKARPSRFAR